MRWGGQPQPSLDSIRRIPEHQGLQPAAVSPLKLMLLITGKQFQVQRQVVAYRGTTQRCGQSLVGADKFKKQTP